MSQEKFIAITMTIIASLSFFVVVVFIITLVIIANNHIDCMTCQDDDLYQYHSSYGKMSIAVIVFCCL